MRDSAVANLRAYSAILALTLHLTQGMTHPDRDLAPQPTLAERMTVNGEHTQTHGAPAMVTACGSSVCTRSLAEHEVHDRVDVGGWAEVLAVVAAEAHVDAVVVVQHAGHAVEAEAVEPACACKI